MPTLHSHTHCQVAPADTQGKTWQRVCLSKRTTDRQTDEEKEALGGNTGFASGGVTPTSRGRLCKLGALCYYSSSVLIDSLVWRGFARHQELASWL
jgi:hypothetical protein